MAEAAACAAYAAANTPAVPSQQQHKKQTTQHILRTDQSDPAEIVLKEVGGIELDGDGEEEVELDEEDLEYEEEEEEEEEEDGERYIVNGDETYRYSISPEVEEPHSDSNSTSNSPSSVKGHLEHMKTARKRPSDELDGEVDESGVSNDDSSDSVTSSRQRRPNGTPPKRAKIGDQLSAAKSIQNASSVPFIGPELSLSFPPSNSPLAASGVSSTPNTNVRRAKKRSSEELSLDDEAEQASSASSPTDAPITSSKRAKVDLERPRSLAPLDISFGRLHEHRQKASG